MPGLRILLIAGVVLMSVGAFWLLWSRRRAGPMLTQTRPLPPMKGSLDAQARRRVSVELGEEILGLLDAGRRAEALALMREASGWNAEEAERMLAKLEGLKKRLES